MATQPTQTIKTNIPGINGVNVVEDNGMIYETAYKKGNLLQKLHFRFAGPLTGAIAKVKAYCYRHHLMHIHTVPFLVNLDEPAQFENEIIIDNQEDWIDVEK